MSTPYRIVVAAGEASAPLAQLLQTGMSALVTVVEPVEAAAACVRTHAEVLMLGTSDIGRIAEVRALSPTVRIAIVALSPSYEDAVSALRLGAQEFIDVAMPSAEIIRATQHLVDQVRAEQSRSRQSQVVLAVGAHPDDVESGVGGILAAHRVAGDEVTVLTLSKGRREGGVELAWAEASASTAVIGAQLIFEDEPMSFTALLTAVARHVEQVRPTIVYTHSKHDRRQDHRVVHEATVAATEEIPTVACYQGTTGTTSFKPTRFVPIDAVIETKLKMLSCFATRGPRPEYLAPDFAVAAARYWSQFGHGAHCEPLELIRESILAPVLPVGLEGPASENAHTGELATV